VRSHEWIDQRSLALHEAVAAKLEGQPALISVARRNLERWLRVNETAALLEWRRLLDVLSMPDLLALLCSPGEDAARLRQSSPFAGVLSPRERQSILDRHDPRSA
jgi:type II secretory pathway component PulL